jgi:hypothetical protein
VERVLVAREVEEGERESQPFQLVLSGWFINPAWKEKSLERQLLLAIPRLLTKVKSQRRRKGGEREISVQPYQVERADSEQLGESGTRPRKYAATGCRGLHSDRATDSKKCLKPQHVAAAVATSQDWQKPNYSSSSSGHHSCLQQRQHE